jgi:hypothetical protein
VVIGNNLEEQASLQTAGCYFEQGKLKHGMLQDQINLDLSQQLITHTRMHFYCNSSQGKL